MIGAGRYLTLEVELQIFYNKILTSFRIQISF